MRLLLPKCQSLALRLFFLLLIIHLKIVAALSFTQSPRAVQYNSTYSIEWSTGDHNKPVTLALTRGAGAATSMVVLTAGTILSNQYQWTPTEAITEGSGYVLMIAQDVEVAYSANIAVGIAPRQPSASTTSMPKTEHSATTLSSASVVTVTATTTIAHTAESSATFAWGDDILNPTPTSSWDAPREEDHSLTINDKIAIGIGVPIALLVLGTIGYWRAAKFFVHRKITGEPKLPMYQVGKGSVPTIVIGAGLRNGGSERSSRAPSLWGASSGRRTRDPSPARGHDAGPIAMPPQIAISPLRADFLEPGRTPSGLRQSWMPG